jgi:beta-lactamase regulating signal transducer with metallopeptidase domain
MMMLAPQPIAFLAPADSAQAVATVYTASLLVVAPLCVAAVAAFLLRRGSAEARVLVWRSALAALLLIFIGRQLPLQWVAWVVPSALATPLVALGRVQVTTAPGAVGHSDLLVRALLVTYLSGMLVVLITTLAASLRMWRIASKATPVRDEDWLNALLEAKRSTGIARRVRFVATSDVPVPMTWGLLRPIVVIPSTALRWDAERCRIVLLHELSHVAAFDWGFNLLARAACAAFWFHPAAWWIARELRADCELAADDRVIAAGVRRSDYAELLVEAADRFLPPLVPALPLGGRAGLRPRLNAILDTRRVVVPLGRRWAAAAALSTCVVVGPMSVVQLAPTRAVLTTLIGDARWESRAYAVIGLARRADSVAVARNVAERDPNPRVRAWARYALEQRADVPGLRGILHQ